MRYAVRLVILQVKRVIVDARNQKEARFVVLQRTNPRLSALALDVQRVQRRKGR